MPAVKFRLVFFRFIAMEKHQTASVPCTAGIFCAKISLFAINKIFRFPLNKEENIQKVPTFQFHLFLMPFNKRLLSLIAFSTVFSSQAFTSEFNKKFCNQNSYDETRSKVVAALIFIRESRNNLHSPPLHSLPDNPSTFAN